MSFSFVVGRKIKLSDFLKIDELDKKTFGGSYNLSLLKGLFWALKSYDGYIAVKNEAGELIAYSSLVALKKEYYDRIKNGKIKDVDLPIKALENLCKKGIHYAYFSSIIIKKEYRSPALIVELMREILKMVSRLAKKGVYFSCVLADAISESGKEFCEKLHFDFVGNTERNTKIYEASLLPLKVSLKGIYGKEVEEIYRKKEETM